MQLYKPQKSNFSPEECFLCGIQLTKEIRTEEHIFPQWLIRQFSLGTKKLSLAFGRKEVGYRKITIPCCKNCNSSVLAPLEARIRKNFIDYWDSEYDLTKEEICLWAGKVYYGMLLFDYHDALKTLEDEEEIMYIKNLLLTPNTIILHTFLQSLIKPIQINCFQLDYPVSFIDYKLKLLPNIEHQFDFVKSPIADSFLIRIGKRGFMIAFDGGYINIYNHVFPFDRYDKFILHPIQFNELSARFMHLSSMKSKERSFLKFSDDHRITINYNFESTKYPYQDLTDEDLLFFLMATSRWPEDAWKDAEGRLLTLLENEDGFIDHPIDRN